MTDIVNPSRQARYPRSAEVVKLFINSCLSTTSIGGSIGIAVALELSTARPTKGTGFNILTFEEKRHEEHP
jgi:hypothetical protein